MGYPAAVMGFLMGASYPNQNNNSRVYPPSPRLSIFCFKLAKHESARAHWAGSSVYRFRRCLGLHTGFSSGLIPCPPCPVSRAAGPLPLGGVWGGWGGAA